MRAVGGEFHKIKIKIIDKDMTSTIIKFNKYIDKEIEKLKNIYDNTEFIKKTLVDTII